MKLMNSYYIYILTNKSNTLYIGVTNNLQKRLYEHKNKLVEGFTKKYNLDKLIYFETYQDINEAIKREKQIKGWIRKRKIELIKSKNPTFEDLSLSFWGDKIDEESLNLFELSRIRERSFTSFRMTYYFFLKAFFIKAITPTAIKLTEAAQVGAICS